MRRVPDPAAALRPALLWPALSWLALATLAPLGVTRLYPAALDEIEALARQCAGDRHVPVARQFAARLLTLPVHALLGKREQAALLRTLADAA